MWKIDRFKFRVPGVARWFIVESSEFTFEKGVRFMPIADWVWVYNGG